MPPRPLDLSFDRSYSPIPPPMPSPQLRPLPLPSPPTFSKRPSSAHSSRDRQTMKQRPKLDMEALQSPVFSLKDAIVVESPRRSSSQTREDRDSSDYQSLRRPKTAGAESSSSIPPQFGLREHRRSGSFAQLSPPASSQSLSRTNPLSPTRKYVHQDSPPPVPPLPQRFSDESMKRSRQKKLPPTPIQIPGLGLGIAEASRTPLSPSSTTSSKSRPRKEMEEQTSFLHMAPKRDKRSSRTASNTASSTEQAVRPAQSLPDIKVPKRRSSSFTSRLLRLGFTQTH